MKKIIFIVIVTIFSCGVFAAPKSPNLKGKLFEKNITKEKKAQKSTTKFIALCSQKQSFTIDCPNNGPTIEIAVTTISFNCETGVIVNIDTWQSGRTCPPPQEL